MKKLMEGSGVVLEQVIRFCSDLDYYADCPIGNLAITQLCAEFDDTDDTG